MASEDPLKEWRGVVPYAHSEAHHEMPGKSSKVQRGSVEDAVLIATEAHAGIVDKAGAPYILHPLRLMLRMGTEEERIAAVLHDVVEDSDWTLDSLRDRGFSEGVVAAVDGLTRREGETYESFIERAATHPVARRVKIADLRDNLDLSRIAEPTDRDRERMAKYAAALDLLLS